MTDTERARKIVALWRETYGQQTVSDEALVELALVAIRAGRRQRS